MKKNYRLAFNVAFCGIVTALAVVFMFLSIIPSFAYVVPAFSGIVIWTVTQHMNVKWAYLCYGASCLISLMLIPEPEANLFFVFFFGYYPTLCILLEKIKNKILRFLVKLVIFNATVVLAYNLLVILFPVEDALEGLEIFGDLAIYAFWGFGNIAFVIYEFALITLKEAYIKLIKPKVAAKLK